MSELIPPTAPPPRPGDYCSSHDSPPPGFFTAVVQGVDEQGLRFEEEVPVDGHLDGNLYVRLSRPMEVGTPLFIVLRLAERLRDGLPIMRVAASGSVERINRLSGESYEVRVWLADYQPL